MTDCAAAETPQIWNEGRRSTLAEMIAAARKARGWTITRAERELGLTRSFLHEVERDERGISLSKVVDIARRLEQRPGPWIEAVFNRQLQVVGAGGQVLYAADG